MECAADTSTTHVAQALPGPAAPPRLPADSRWFYHAHSGCDRPPSVCGRRGVLRRVLLGFSVEVDKFGQDAATASPGGELAQVLETAGRLIHRRADRSRPGRWSALAVLVADGGQGGVTSGRNQTPREPGQVPIRASKVRGPVRVRPARSPLGTGGRDQSWWGPDSATWGWCCGSLASGPPGRATGFGRWAHAGPSFPEAGAAGHLHPRVSKASRGTRLPDRSGTRSGTREDRPGRGPGAGAGSASGPPVGGRGGTACELADNGRCGSCTDNGRTAVRRAPSPVRHRTPHRTPTHIRER